MLKLLNSSRFHGLAFFAVGARGTLRLGHGGRRGWGLPGPGDRGGLARGRGSAVRAGAKAGGQECAQLKGGSQFHAQQAGEVVFGQEGQTCTVYSLLTEHLE